MKEIHILWSYCKIIIYTVPTVSCCPAKSTSFAEMFYNENKLQIPKNLLKYKILSRNLRSLKKILTNISNSIKKIVPELCLISIYLYLYIYTHLLKIKLWRQFRIWNYVQEKKETLKGIPAEKRDRIEKLAETQRKNKQNAWRRW